MSNSLETVSVPSGTITFDHSTCVIKATWNNGYTETWPKRGYDYDTCLASFRNMVDTETSYTEPLCEMKKSADRNNRALSDLTPISSS